MTPARLVASMNSSVRNHCPGPGEILDVDVDEGGVRVIDVAVDGPIYHAIAAALPSLRPVLRSHVSKSSASTRAIISGMKCLLAVLRSPGQSRPAVARYGHARSEQAGRC
jgi:hypothetical protein